MLRPGGRGRVARRLPFRWGTLVGIGGALILLVLAARGTPTTPVRGAPPARSSPAASRCLPASGTASTAELQPATGSGRHAAAIAADRPGQRLVLATAAAHYSPGASVRVVAALEVPAQSVGPPGSGSGLSAPPLIVGACIDAVIGGQPLVAEGGASTTPATPSASSGVTAVTLLIPPLTPTGTTIVVTATIPADVPYAGASAMSVRLRLAVV